MAVWETELSLTVYAIIWRCGLCSAGFSYWVPRIPSPEQVQICRLALATGVEVAALHPLQIWLHTQGICEISKTDILISPLKDVVENNENSSTYVTVFWPFRTRKRGIGNTTTEPLVGAGCHLALHCPYTSRALQYESPSMYVSCSCIFLQHDSHRSRNVPYSRANNDLTKNNIITKWRTCK